MELLLYANEATKNPKQQPILAMEYLQPSTVLDELPGTIEKQSPLAQAVELNPATMFSIKKVKKIVTCKGKAATLTLSVNRSSAMNNQFITIHSKNK